MTPTRFSVRLALALAILLTTLAPAAASSHREAPGISNDPVADNTDVYFFRDPVAPSRLVMIGNWIPLEEPAGGPNFFHFEPNIRYEFNVDSNGDAIEDYVYRLIFTRNVRNGANTFLQNTGPVSSPTDPNLNVYYTYVVEKCLGPSPGQTSCATLGADLIEAPNNVGPKSYPAGYGKGSDIASTVYSIDEETRVFVGQRAEQFYVDLGMIFDLIHFRPGTLPGDHGGGINTTAGYNVHTIALSVPIQNLTNNHTVPTDTADPNAIVSMWSSTWRRATTTLSASGAAPSVSGGWVQVSRLGNPLVNEVVVPIGVKDQFNATYPVDDAQFAAAILDPILPKALKALFDIDSPPAPRNDLLALVQGVDGLTKRPGEVISDQLRLNVAVYPTPIYAVNRLGVIAGDLSGYPNGRRPYDDTVDIALRVVAGVLVEGFDVFPNNALGDGVDGPDVPFIAGFPFLYTPHSGYERTHDDAPTVTRFAQVPTPSK